MTRCCAGLPGQGGKQKSDAFLGISVLADAEADTEQPRTSNGLTAVWPQPWEQRQNRDRTETVFSLHKYDIVTSQLQTETAEMFEGILSF